MKNNIVIPFGYSFRDRKAHGCYSRQSQIRQVSSNGFQEFREIYEDFFGDEGIIAQTIREFNEHLEIVPSFTEMLSVIKWFPEEDISFKEAKETLSRLRAQKHKTCIPNTTD